MASTSWNQLSANLDVNGFNIGSATPTDLTNLHNGTLAAVLDPVSAGIVTIPRYHMQVSGGLNLSSGVVRLAYKLADVTVTLNNLTARSGSTSPSAITLCRMGIYSVDGSGNLTLVGSTVNDTTLFSVINTLYTKALSAPVSLTAGTVYAFAILQVATTTATASGLIVDGAEAAVAPRLTAQLGSQSDLPSTIAVGALSSSTSMFYVRGS